MTTEKIYFFGWTNIKWFIIQIGLTFSEQESFFSSKRIERAIIFNDFIYNNFDFSVTLIL
jgi:hypothetical protein